MVEHWLISCVLLIQVSAKANASADTAITASGKEALQRFLATYEPEIPWLVDHYVKNRQFKIIRTDFDRQGKENAKAEIQYLSSDSSVRAVLTHLAKPPKRVEDPSHPLQPSEKEFPQLEGYRRPIETGECAIWRPDAFYALVIKDSTQYVFTQMGAGGKVEFVRGHSLVGSGTIPFSIGGLLHSENVRRPQVQRLEMSECEWDGERLACVRWEEKISDDVTLRIAHYFDAKNHWIWRGQEREYLPRRIIQIQRLKFGPLEDGFAPPLRFEHSSKEPGKPEVVDQRYEYFEFTTAHPDASAFTLSQFGLTEPSRSMQEPSMPPVFGLHTLLIGGGLLLLALSIFGFSFRCRKTAKAA